jgi:Holliday junction resolvase RusA-like endonuclease
MRTNAPAWEQHLQARGLLPSKQVPKRAPAIPAMQTLPSRAPRRAAQPIHITGLPIAPGVNGLFINAGRKRVVSPGYRAWREQASAVLTAQRPGSITGPVRITLDVGKTDRRKADIDGRAKAPIDLLVQLGIIPGDDFSIVREVNMRWVFGSETMTVLIEQLDAPLDPFPPVAKRPHKSRAN